MADEKKTGKESESGGKPRETRQQRQDRMREKAGPANRKR